MTSPIIYEAQVFHAKYPKGRSSGTLQVSPTELVFTGRDESLRIPLAGLILEMGGANDRLVFIRHPAVPDYSFYTSDRSLLNNDWLRSTRALNNQLAGLKQRRRRNLAVTLVISGLLVALITLPFFFMDQAVRVLAARLPAGIEREIGEKIFAQYSFTHEILENDQGQAALATLVAPLVANLPAERFDFKFYIVADADINAFALPGGYVILNSGLIQAASAPEEILGVAAHELSHVVKQHGIRHIMSSTGIFVLLQTILGDVSGLAAVLAEAAPMLINQQYSRDFEREADANGYELLIKSGINPSGLLTFFEKLLAEERKMLAKVGNEQGARILKSTLSILSTHPATEERLAHFRQRLEAQPPARYRDYSAQFHQLTESVNRFASKQQ